MGGATPRRCVTRSPNVGVRSRTRGTILDFGCATGRITRQLLGVADPDAELWGVDVHAPSIAWCAENLSPPFHFVTCTTAPHLPFRDGYFDLVIAASVLDTMVELRDAWLLELRRVLAPGGALYLTLVDRGSVEILLGVPAEHRLAPVGATIRRAEQAVDFLGSDWSTATIQVGTTAHAIYDLDQFRSAWEHAFDIGPPHPRVRRVRDGTRAGAPVGIGLTLLAACLRSGG